MKKIGLVSCYFKDNYGSQLQAYATQKVLEDYGFRVETINISKNKDFSNGKKKYYMGQIFNFNFIKTKFGMIKLKIDKKLNKELGRNIAIRNKKFKEFKKVYHLTPAYPTYEKLNEISKNYDAVLVGSDQLWLPVNIVSDYYTLNWVNENTKRISYSTSFGVSSIPKKYEKKYKDFLEKIDCLSVREESGNEIIKEILGKEASVVCDPTLLLSKTDWMDIQEKEPIIKEKYIFCYFLGSNIEYRKFAERLKEKTGYKIVSINHCDEYVKYSDTFADIIPYDVGPGEFVNMIRNAEYVCTDSFHGTVFSLINNKLFFAFRRHYKKSKNSTNSRLDSLLEKVDLKERILEDDFDEENALKMQIDYDRVNQKLNEFITKSKKFLENSLDIENYQKELQKEKKNYIIIDNKEECCGCTACYNICPKDAIEMKEDNEGFRYPIINESKCVECGLCRKVCPIINRKKEEKIEQKGYVVNNRNTEVRKESTSGGAFSAIAEYVLEKSGVVFGAAFDENFEVEHTSATTKEELSKFRNSKYVQSNPKKSFQEAKKFLNEGRMVCFSGTPCQIEGLKSFLNQDYPNLITVDVVCRAVPSPKVLRMYLSKYKKKLGGKVCAVRFRDKSKYGYNYSSMVIKTDQNEYREGVETDSYLRAFFADYIDRPSCYDCKFKKRYRKSDITIWDCFEVEQFSKKLNDNIGTTRMLIHSQKGRELFEAICDQFDYVEFEPERLIKNVRQMYESVEKQPRRKEFFEALEKDGEKVFDEYFPKTPKTQTEKMARVFLIKTPFYKKIKTAIKKIIRK